MANKKLEELSKTFTYGGGQSTAPISHEQRYGKGNIDLYNRPQYKNPDGSISTVYSMSFNDNGKEVLIPSIAYDSFGKPAKLTSDQAIQRYYDTGEYLGKFNTPEEADQYAEWLHEQQAKIYSNPSSISQSGKQNPLARLAETFSYDTKVEIPKTQPKAVPSLAQPSFDYESVIKEYESLPSTNILSRLFSKDSRDAYNRKQELNPQYEQAKDAQTRKRLSDLGLSESEVRNAYNLDFGNGGYYLPELLKKAGVTDKKEYNDLYSALDKMFTRTAQSEANERNIKLADEHPVIGSALTVPGKMLAGAGNAIESRVNYLTGNPLSNTSGSLAANKSMNEMRGAVSDDMSGVGKSLYGWGMSTADMLANRWLLGNVGNLSMGFGKEADTMNEAIDQGLNPAQIMGKGLASGATTYITEKMLTTKSLDAAKESILDLLKEGGLKALGKGGIVKVLLPILAKSGVAEGTQEGLENIADTIADVFIAGGKNELTQSYNQYKANGLSNDEALKKVAGDKALELLEDTAGGFLSGFVMGGAEMGKSGIEYNLNKRNNIPALNQQNTTQETVPTIEQNTPTEQPTSVDLPTVETQQTNTPIEGLTPAQEPKTYDTKNVSDKSLNRILNDHFKMFASNEEGTAIKDQLKQAINEYEDTLSNDALNRINALVQRSEEIMKNGNYEWKRDSGKRSEKVRHTTYPNYRGTVTDNVMTYIENAKVKNELVNKANSAYRTEIKEMANTLTKANADISAWDSLSEVKESFDNYVKTGDETYLETAMTAVEEMARAADISYSQVQKAFENGLTNAMKAEENKSLPTVNKVMKEDVGINGRDEEIDDGPIRLVEPVNGGIPDIRTRNTYTSKVARNTLEKFYSQDEKSYQRLVDNVLEGKHQVELQQMKDTNSKAVERIEKYGPDTTYEDVMRNGVNSAEDVALVHNLMKWYQAQGDFDKVDMLAIKLTHGGHNIGQTLQYFKAFGDSALGMNQATDTIAGSKTKELVNQAKKHPNSKAAQVLKQNAKLAAALQQIEGLGQMEKAPKTEATYQQILQEVRNTLAKESASFEDRFSDTDVEYLARLIRNGASTADIKSALDRHLATGYFGMSQEDLQAITELYNKADKAKTSKERAELKEQAAAIAAKYSGSSTFMDKWNSWRYLAMLGNPRTLIRNRLGNFTFRQVTNIKDFVAAGLENAAQAAGIKFDRTKSMSLNPVTDAELFKASRADFDNVAYEEATRGGSKYNMKSAVEGKRKVFNTKGVEWLKDKVSNQLEQDDIKALKAKYTQALAGYLKANGYGADVLKTDNAILDKARAYAIQQAKIATFHEDSKTANLLNDLERRARESGGLAGKTAEILMESTMPFKKTPINILKQGVQYSPASLISAVYHITTKADANVWIDDLAKSLTGSTIMWLGYLLGKSGLLIGQRKDEDDPFNKGSNYALNIGDKSITIDWLAPAALPLFVGCELANSVSDKSESGELALLETVASISEPVVEMSMMQGLENALSSLSNIKNFKGATFLENIGAGYASQVVPTLAGQLARTIDPLRRTTRTDDSFSDKPLEATLEKAKQKVVNKLPGLSMTNQPYLNAWGETEKNASGVFGGNVLGRALQNFVLPGYVNDTSLSSREKGLAKLEETYKKNGYSGSLIPSLADNNKPNGTRLSNEEYTRWAQTRGNEMKKAVDAGLLYKGKVSTKDLQDYMHDLELLANAIAKNRQFGTEIPKTYKKKYEAYINGGKSYRAVMEYLIKNSK